MQEAYPPYDVGLLPVGHGVSHPLSEVIPIGRAYALRVPGLPASRITPQRRGRGASPAHHICCRRPLHATLRVSPLPAGPAQLTASSSSLTPIWPSSGLGDSTFER